MFAAHTDATHTMPPTLTAPPRLFQTSLYVVRTGDEDLGIAAGRSVAVAYAFDLDDVVSLREYHDFDDDYPGQELCRVEYGLGEDALVLTPYRTVLAAWQAWRTHAEAYARLRN